MTEPSESQIKSDKWENITGELRNVLMKRFKANNTKKDFETPRIVCPALLFSACQKNQVSDKKSSFSRLANSEDPQFTNVNEEFSDKRNAENGVFLSDTI